jgi:hypothetical protein
VSPIYPAIVGSLRGFLPCAGPRLSPWIDGDGLALGLGVVFIVAGLAETYRAVSSGDGGVVFWFGSLFGGGTLIIIGAFAVTRRTWLSFSLTAIGCVAAANATMWTLILRCPRRRS